jgi:hypothetical protein
VPEAKYSPNNLYGGLNDEGGLPKDMGYPLTAQQQGEGKPGLSDLSSVPLVEDTVYVQPPCPVCSAFDQALFNKL